MAVFTQKRDYQLKGRMGKIVIDDHIRQAVSDSGIQEGYVMVFVAGCVAALAVTEAEPNIMNHDLDHLFSTALGLPYGEYFADGSAYQHHQRWHDDNGSSHLRALLLNHSLSIPVMDEKVMLGPWQNIVLIECDTKDRKRTLYYQVQGE
ncbi:MAG: secondary thiamine-phosphate synthase enzyme YjbQ [Spirochaetales bacterium]|nr:secondary thiamine-phosphate synthase enzyme YjbQ [Spirochaetales bacterium]